MSRFHEHRLKSSICLFVLYDLYNRGITLSSDTWGGKCVFTPLLTINNATGTIYQLLLRIIEKIMNWLTDNENNRLFYTLTLWCWYFIHHWVNRFQAEISRCSVSKKHGILHFPECNTTAWFSPQWTPWQVKWQEVVVFALTLCCWRQCTGGHRSLYSSPRFLSPLLLPSSASPLSPWLSSSGIPSPAARLASWPPPVPARLESSPTGWSPSRPDTEDRDTQQGRELWTRLAAEDNSQGVWVSCSINQRQVS